MYGGGHNWSVACDVATLHPPASLRREHHGIAFLSVSIASWYSGSEL
jgi:hypothetical protein